MDRPAGDRMDLDAVQRAPGAALPPSTARSTRVDAPAWRRSEVELVGVERDGLAGRAVAVDDGRAGRPSLRRRATALPVTVRLAAARRGRSDIVVNLSGVGGAPARARGRRRGRTGLCARRDVRPRLPQAGPVAHAVAPGRRPGVGSPRRGSHHPDRRRRVRRRARHPVRPPAGGLRGDRRALGRGGPGVRHQPGPGPHRAGRPPAGHGRLRGAPPPARGRLQGPGPVPHRARRRVRQGRRPGAGRGRLRDQAVRAARADEPHPGAPAPRLRGPRRTPPAAA